MRSLRGWRYELVELLRFRVMMLEGRDLQTCSRCQDLEEELFEREQEIAELHAELRKYEPSDGVMFKVRSLEDRIEDLQATIETYRGLCGVDLGALKR